MWLEGRCERTRFYWINSVWFLLLSPWLRSWVGVDSWMVWICFLVLWLGSSEAFMPWHTRPSAVCLGNCGYKRSVMLFPAHQLTGHTRHWRGQKCPSEWIFLKLGGRLFAAYSQIITFSITFQDISAHSHRQACRKLNKRIWINFLLNVYSLLLFVYTRVVVFFWNYAVFFLFLFFCKKSCKILTMQ